MGTTEIFERMARLTAVHDELARADDPQDFLRAMGAALAPLGVAYIDLAYLNVDASGAPDMVEIVASWEAGAPIDSALVGGCFAVADFAIGRLMLRTFDRPQFIADVKTEEGLAEMLSAVGRSVASAVLLPLYSAHQGGWQGIVGAYWTSPHEADAAEQALHGLLMRMFAASLASHRTGQALQASLRRNEALLERTEAALREAEAQQATLRVMLDNLPLGVAVVRGDTGERELVNRLGARMLGDHGDSTQIAASQPFAYFPGETAPIAMERLPHVQTLMTGETTVAEIEFEFTAGKRSLFDVTTSLLRYPGDPAPRVIVLYQDITEARRQELERMRAQDELLKAQTVALAERSTPLIPVRDDVLVMPLIGTIDAERGRRIVETLVNLGGATHVRAAIIDITGVRDLDTGAAGTLIGAARALRLRGVRPIITGIQPDVAATLVNLGVDLVGITVCATLQAGVARASEG